MKKILLYVLVMLFLTAGMAVADDEESWFEIGGDYRLRYDNLKGTVHDYIQITDAQRSLQAVPGYSVKNDSLPEPFWTQCEGSGNREHRGQVSYRMYKVWGHQSRGLQAIFSWIGHSARCGPSIRTCHSTLFGTRPMPRGVMSVVRLSG
jgi:hypothetical protein